MLRIVGIALLAAVAGYIVGVFLGIGLVTVFSTNRHDKSMEAGMTGFFFVGPLLAALGFLGALLYQFLARRGR